MRLFLIFLWICIIILSLSSCHPTLRLYYGIHNPKFETVESVSNYAKRKKIDGPITFIPKDSAAYAFMFSAFKGLPNLLVFDSIGHALTYSSNESCNAEAFKLSTTICENQLSRNDSVGTLQSLLALLKPLYESDSLRYKQVINKQVAYTTLISWNKSIGRLNKDHVRPWIQDFTQNTDCSINTFLINFDFIDGIWTKEKFRALHIKYD